MFSHRDLAQEFPAYFASHFQEIEALLSFDLILRVKSSVMPLLAYIGQNLKANLTPDPQLFSQPIR
jgi:hypothetical protein